MEQTRTGKAVMLMKGGDIKGALSIFRTFRIGFTNEERRMLEIASESLNGHASFYRSLGIDTQQAIDSSLALLTKKYL